MASVTLLARLVGDAKSMTAAFMQGEKAAGALDKTMQAARGGALIVGAAASGALVMAVKSGSDFNEVLSKSNTIFGSNAKAIETWAEGAAKGFGQSKTQALNAAGSFGNMFTQLGIGSDEAAKMSKKMVELASDFASFHNADISEVLIAQQAAFRGEYDALQRFVPTINAALVQEKAMAMGLAKTTKELTMQHKALATQALIIEGAGAAAGDFARTQDGAANKTRQFQAQLADIAANVGTAVLPVLMKLAPMVIGFLEALAKVPGPVLAAMLGLVALVGVLVLVAPAITALIALAPLMGAAFTLMLGPVGLIILAIGALVAAGVLLWQNWDAIVKKAGEVATAISNVTGLEASTVKSFGGAVGKGAIGGIPVIGPAISAALAVGGLSGKFGGGRANGGPVSGGTSYLVGERGPELFTPNGSGRIGGMGGTVVNITVDGFVLGSSAELTRLIQKGLNDAQQRFGGVGY